MSRSLLREATGQVAATLDRAFARVALSSSMVRPGKVDPESLDHRARMRGLRAIEAFYRRPGVIEQPQLLFARHASIAPSTRKVRGFPGGEVVDLQWSSEFVPLWDDAEAIRRASRGTADEIEIAHVLARLDRSGSIREKYLAVTPNRTAHARLYRHRGAPRPTVVLLHGYMTGHFAFEERVWPLQRLLGGGFNVALSVLPFHGPRRDRRRGLRPPAFPSNDPRFTIEGFRQLVIDHVALIDYMLGSDASSVGVMGTSLGGYAAALLATVEPRLRFAVLHVPLASIDSFAYDNGRLIGDASQRRAQTEALRRAQWIVSPFARRPVVDAHSVLAIGGDADRVTGTEHSRRLADHFGAPHVTFPGGHLLQLGRTAAFEPAFDMLRREGLYTAP